MTDLDRPKFAGVMAAVFTYYGKEFSDAVFDIYWQGLRMYEVAAIRDALGRHAKNPDTGQFLPKIADLEKMIGGTTLDSALVALHKVEKAFSAAGCYATVAFNDPIIHRVIDEMGGWVMCATSKDWTFRRKEFENRYRGYKMRGEVPEYPSRLVGIADGENGSKGFKVSDENLVLIGDVDEVKRVILGGTDSPRLALTHVGHGLGGALQLLEAKP